MQRPRVHIIYPSPLEDIASQLLAELDSRVKSICFSMVSCESNGSAVNNSFQPIEDSAAILVVGGQEEEKTEEGFLFKAEKIFAGYKAKPRYNAAVDTLTSGDPLVGTIYKLTEKDYCIPLSLIYNVVDTIDRGFEDQGNKLFPIPTGQIIDNFNDDRTTWSLFSCLIHSGTWFDYINNYSIPLSKDGRNFSLIRSIIGSDIKNLKGVHSYHPFVVRLFGEIDKKEGDLKRAISAFDEKERHAQGIKEAKDSAFALSELLKAIRLNCFVAFTRQRQECDYIDILLAQLEIISLSDKFPISEISIPYDRWNKMEMDFKNSKCYYWSSTEQINRQRGKLPGFIPEEIKKKVGTHAPTESLKQLAILYDNLFREVLHVTESYIKLAFRNETSWAVEDTTNATIYENLSDSVDRLVVISNKIILQLLEIVKTAVVET